MQDIAVHVSTKDNMDIVRAASTQSIHNPISRIETMRGFWEAQGCPKYEHTTVAGKTTSYSVRIW